MQTVRNRVLLAKEENVYGTDPTPTVANNAIEAKNVKVNYIGDLLERNNIRNNISPVSPVIGKRYIEVTFECELKGSGTKGTAGRIGDLLEACSFAETASAGSSVTYVPTSSGQKSVTIYVYDLDSSSAVLKKITGAVGTINVRCVAGQYATLEFIMRGLYNAPVDVALPSAPTYETTLPPIVESAAFTLNAIDTLVVQDVTVNVANEIAVRDDMSVANAIKAFTVIGRKPKGSFNPEAALIAAYDFWADWIASTQKALSIVIGSASGNKCTITAPKVTIDSLADADRDGILTRDIPFSLGQDAGNDEIQLKFE
jgi:hypothetical protein